jgi:hypothetical protein
MTAGYSTQAAQPCLEPGMIGRWSSFWEGSERCVRLSDGNRASHSAAASHARSA